MPGQRSKDKKHFTASVENELFAAIEEYAKIHGLDRNTAVKTLLWQQVDAERIAEAPSEYRAEPKKITEE